MLVSQMSENPGKVRKVIKVDSLEEVAVLATMSDWAPGVFKENARSAANFKQVEFLVLDVDSGCTLEEAKEKFKDYAHAILTSRNHQKEKNGVVADRFRVILPLIEPVCTQADYEATWLEAQAKWPFIDKSCKDVSRMYYMSPELVELSPDGLEIPVKYGITPAKPELPDKPLNERGSLWKATLDFLVHGAPAGERHLALVKCVSNMREQGYTQDEVETMIEAMTHLPTADWTQAGLNSKDKYTIKDIFKRPDKYEFKPKEVGAVASQLTNSALELLDEALDYIGDKAKVAGDSTGIEGLDKILGGGFRTGELTVLMAQAKQGKNSFYHYLIYQMMMRGIPVAYASRELTPATEVIPNLLSIATGNNAWKVEVTDGYRELAKGIVSQWPLKFAQGYGYFPPEQMVKWVTAMKEEGINHFLFDHLHYMLKGEDYESTAELIKILKSLTKELDIHINLIVQPRTLREGERLSLATLRGGAAIGQALDNLLILERVRGEDFISKLTLEVARHKLARPGSVYMQYNPESTTFEEVEKETVVTSGPPEGLENRGRFGRNFPRAEEH